MPVFLLVVVSNMRGLDPAVKSKFLETDPIVVKESILIRGAESVKNLFKK